MRGDERWMLVDLSGRHLGIVNPVFAPHLMLTHKDGILLLREQIPTSRDATHLSTPCCNKPTSRDATHLSTHFLASNGGGGWNVLPRVARQSFEF